MGISENSKAVLDIAVALSAQKDRHVLLKMIIDKSMELTSSDAGTLYMYEDGVLKFCIMKTVSLGIDKGMDSEIDDIPPVAIKEENICAYCVLHKETVNIEDVYNTDRFDFDGPKRYDAMTGYRTVSMLAIPLIDGDDEPVGVLQLMNAKDDNGKIRPYRNDEEQLILALASQTAIVLSNMRYQEEIKDQMWSFTEAMAEAIDARTPYNASHTRRVAEYCALIVDYINELHEKGETEDCFSQNRKEQLVMGALLHDIGKMITPLEVMNKESRLGGKEEKILNRLELFRTKARVALLEGRISTEKYNEVCTKTDEAAGMIDEVNFAGFISPEKLVQIDTILEYGFVDNGNQYNFFEEDEKQCLRIQKGTLTAEERDIIQQHVVMTERILDKVHFNKYFADSPKWAAQHHECLNGKGYPKGLLGNDLALDARIIAVADICDALLAVDRPYKKAVPKEKAFDIMRGMAKDGNIDGRIVEYLYDALA